MFKWNLRQMFYWTLVIALIIPYLISLIPKPVEPAPQLESFLIDDSDLTSWIQEVDSTAKSIGGMGGASGGSSSFSAESNHVFTLKNATVKEVFAHLEHRIGLKIKSMDWEIQESGGGSGTDIDSQYFVVNKGVSQYRLYLWNVPPSEKHRKKVAADEQVIQIKLFSIGYLVPKEKD